MRASRSHGIDAHVFARERVGHGLLRRRRPDVVAVGDEHDAACPEARPADLGLGGAERVPEVRPLGERGVLGQRGGDRLLVRGEGQHNAGRVLNVTTESGVPGLRAANVRAAAIASPIESFHAVRGVDQEHGADPERTVVDRDAADPLPVLGHGDIGRREPALLIGGDDVRPIREEGVAAFDEREAGVGRVGAAAAPRLRSVQRGLRQPRSLIYLRPPLCDVRDR